MESTGSLQQSASTPVVSPLRQLSSDQMNQQRIPQSPSMQTFSDENDQRGHHRSRESISSDVQGKVAFLNSLSTPSSPTKAVRAFALPHTPTHGALQRAVLGFEESQASLASANAEIERLREQVKSSKHRERMVSERIESLMEQLQTERESRGHDKKHYVAEVKKCRKQAYQAELTQLETQETLKEVKQELKRAQAETHAERTKKEEARQEAFERAYALSGLTEELESVKAALRSMEKERDAAVQEAQSARAPEFTFNPVDNKITQTSPLRSEQHQVVDTDSESTLRAIEIRGQQPVVNSTNDLQPTAHDCCKAASLITDPYWSEFVDRDQCLRDLHDESYTLEDHIRSLYDEVKATQNELRRQRQQVDFMHLQCQAGSCSCKRAEKRGERYIYSSEFERFRNDRAAKKRKLKIDAESLAPSAEFAAVEDSEVSAALADEAAQVPLPLPSPKEQELTFQIASPEPTALLEELTQVMVEPGQAASQFTFSTSTSRPVVAQPEDRDFQANNNVTSGADVDLFDMSQPKHYPPRPSTSMGILTLTSPERSPIRLVPESPDTRSLPPRSATRHEESNQYSSQTTRVALKDSPPRSHRHVHSRPNIRSQSRTRSPLVTSDVNDMFEKGTSASPAASTFFPVTPLVKHQRAQTQQTFTTTTTVPLRDTADDNLSHGHLTPASHSRHAHTQPLNVSTDSDPSMTSQMLSGITGTPVSRDAALAQIRARRDRARSMNMKKMETGSKTPNSARRGITLRDVTGGTLARENREVSVASVQTAPGRF